MTNKRSEQQRSYVILSGVSVFLLCSAFFISTRLQLTVDLGYFLPAPRTIDQQLLVERLGQGPGSRLMFISLPVEAETSDVGNIITQNLLATGLFSAVSDDCSEASDLLAMNHLDVLE